MARQPHPEPQPPAPNPQRHTCCAPALVGGDGEVRTALVLRARLVDGAARHVQHISNLHTSRVGGWACAAFNQPWGRTPHPRTAPPASAPVLAPMCEPTGQQNRGSFLYSPVRDEGAAPTSSVKSCTAAPSSPFSRSPLTALARRHADSSCARPPAGEPAGAGGGTCSLHRLQPRVGGWVFRWWGGGGQVAG